jgi:hypothetical protein
MNGREIKNAIRSAQALAIQAKRAMDITDVSVKVFYRGQHAYKL